MANGIFTIESTTKELKGKEVTVNKDGLRNDETGEVVKFSDIFSPFVGQVINFSVKVTDKVEDKFEAPENEEEEE
jgi:hypothetical protein